MIAVCIDSEGLTDLLTEGWEYRIERLPVQAVRVWISDDNSIVCCRDRFEVCTGAE